MARGTQQVIGSVIGKNMSKSRGFQLGLSLKKLFRQEKNQVSGMTDGDDFVLTGPTERLTEFGNNMTRVYPIKAKLISYVSAGSIKALTNRRLRWEKRGIVYQHVPRHVDVLVDLSTAALCKHQQRIMRQKKSQRRWIKFSTASTSRRLQDVCSSVKIERTQHSL